MKLNKKKIIIIASSVLALLLIIFLIVFLAKKNGNISNNNNTDVPKSFTPDFLSVEEKAKMGISAENKIQAMARDEKGEVTVYKIIKNDSDIIDPAQVTPISPRALSR